MKSHQRIRKLIKKRTLIWQILILLYLLVTLVIIKLTNIIEIFIAIIPYPLIDNRQLPPNGQAAPGDRRTINRPTARLYVLMCVCVGLFTAIATASVANDQTSVLTLPVIAALLTTFVSHYTKWQKQKRRLIELNDE